MQTIRIKKPKVNNVMTEWWCDKCQAWIDIIEQHECPVIIDGTCRDIPPAWIIKPDGTVIDCESAADAVRRVGLDAPQGEFIVRMPEQE